MTDQPRPTRPSTRRPSSRALLSNSAVMAAGTTVSRLSGFVRAALLSYALGKSVHADVFNVANSLPNMLYILLAGGIFNAVLVPQLVRATAQRPRPRRRLHQPGDHRGRPVPRSRSRCCWWSPRRCIVDLVAPSYDGAVRDSAIAFTRLCLPQVFFYGMYVLVGQILNARGSFGPMMWAPIANNVDRGRRDRSSTSSSTARPRATEVYGGFTVRPGAAARPRLDARHRGAAADPGAVPAPRRLRLPTAARPARQRPRPHAAAGHLDGAVRRSSTRSPTSSCSGSPPAVRPQSAGRHRLHRLLLQLPRGDGPALDRHGLAGDRDAAAALGARGRRRPHGAGRLAGEHAARRAGGDRAVRRAAAGDRARPGPGASSRTAPRRRAASTPTSRRSRCSASASCSSPSTTWCCAASTPSSRTAPSSSCSAGSRPPTSWPRSRSSPRPTAEHTSPALVVAYAASYVVGSAVSYLLLRRRLGGLRSRAAPGLRRPAADRHRAGDRADVPRGAGARRPGRRPGHRRGRGPAGARGGRRRAAVPGLRAAAADRARSATVLDHADPTHRGA